MRLDFNYNEKTRLKNWWQQVKSNFRIIEDWANELKNKGVTAEYLDDGAVTTDKIADGAVTTDKIADRAVTQKQISQYTIQDDNMNVSSVTARAIRDEAVTEPKIADGAVTKEKLNAELVGEIDKKADKENAGGGFAGGKGASTANGGAIGNGASTGGGAAVGKNAKSTEGGAALGADASAVNGGAVGTGAKATNGFSGGYLAKSDVDSIQLGSGENKNEKTLQVYDYTLMNADGSVPSERIPIAAIDKVGGIKPYSQNGVNRSGLVVYTDGSAVVNAVSDYGLTRTGDGKVVTAEASEAEIDEGAHAYKVVTPRRLKYALKDISERCIYFGECASAATETDKTVEIPGFELKDGAAVLVRFAHDTEPERDFTLNINSTGAKTVVVNGVDGFGSYPSRLYQGATLLLTYDETTDNYAIAQSSIVDFSNSAHMAHKLNSEHGFLDIGSATRPVYFKDGVPEQTDYTLEKSVPADAKFTDTTYDPATADKAGLMSAEDKAKLDDLTKITISCGTAAPEDLPPNSLFFIIEQ